MTTDEATLVLEDTLEYLSDPKHWWDGGELVDGSEQHCLVTGMHYFAAGRGVATAEAHYRVRRVIASMTDTPFIDVRIPAFNDSHSHEDIVLVLKRAIHDA